MAVEYWAISVCPLCGQRHVYELAIKRTMSFISGPSHLIEMAFGRPAEEVTSMTQKKVRRFTKDFPCPVYNQSFQFTFDFIETNMSSVFTLRIMGLSDNATDKILRSLY